MNFLYKIQVKQMPWKAEIRYNMPIPSATHRPQLTKAVTTRIIPVKLRVKISSSGILPTRRMFII